MRNLTVSGQIVFDFDVRDDVVVDLSDEAPISYGNGLIKQHGNDGESVIVDLTNVFLQEQTTSSDEICSGLCWLSDGRIIISFYSGLLISYETGTPPEVVGSFPTGLQVRFYFLEHSTFKKCCKVQK